MEVASEYSNSKVLCEYFHNILQSDFICSLGITIAEIRSAIEFFIANWSALKSHDPSVVVGSSVLVGIYRVGSQSLKKSYRIIKRLATSIAALRSCIYDVMKARGIPLTYEIGECPDLIQNHWEKLAKS